MIGRKGVGTYVSQQKCAEHLSFFCFVLFTAAVIVIWIEEPWTYAHTHTHDFADDENNYYTYVTLYSIHIHIFFLILCLIWRGGPRSFLSPQVFRSITFQNQSHLNSFSKFKRLFRKKSKQVWYKASKYIISLWKYWHKTINIILKLLHI